MTTAPTVPLVVSSRADLASALGRLWERAGTVALVPTMGALHAGHEALLARAGAVADAIVVSVFVNPLQFGAGEDLGRYPRQEKQDLAALESAGVELVWLPGVGDLYPEGFATRISVGGVSDRWEGEARPGHFEGVATVVAKLLIAVAPEVALADSYVVPAALGGRAGPLGAILLGQQAVESAAI